MLSMNENAALVLILEFISLKELISAAMDKFAESDNTKSQEMADLCSKAITFLK